MFVEQRFEGMYTKIIFTRKKSLKIKTFDYLKTLKYIYCR